MTDTQYHDSIRQANRNLRDMLAKEGLPPTTIARIVARHSQIHAALSAYQHALMEGYEVHMTTMMAEALQCRLVPFPVEDDMP